MRYDIKTTNVTLTPDIEEVLEKKMQALDKVLVSEDPSSIYAQVELERTTRHHQSGEIMRAEINLTVGGKQFRADAVHENLGSAITAMKKEIMREVGEEKNKKIHAVRSGAGRAKEEMRG